MTRHRTRILLACAATGAVLASPAAAKADSNSFLQDLDAYGFYGPPAALLAAGYAVCQAFNEGATSLQIAQWVYRNTDLSVSAIDAANFTTAAAENLCTTGNEIT